MHYIGVHVDNIPIHIYRHPFLREESEEGKSVKSVDVLHNLQFNNRDNQFFRCSLKKNNPHKKSPIVTQLSD